MKDPRAVRTKLKMNQTDFWGRVLVTQSAASRYESGRDIPRAVQTLLTIAYGTDKQAGATVDKLRGAASA